jgi:hypothetical protein
VLIVSVLTVALGHAGAALAQLFHTRHDSYISGFQGDRTKATALFLRPLVVTLPIFGWILAWHNLLGGVHTSMVDLSCSPTSLPSSECVFTYSGKCVSTMHVIRNTSTWPADWGVTIECNTQACKASSND